MDRFTKAGADGRYFVEEATIRREPSGYRGAAVDRLAALENVYDFLLAQQEAIARELEKLRRENKTNTVKFRQLLANKLTNSTLISLFETNER